MKVLEARGLKKHYQDSRRGTVYAVDGIDFAIVQGELLGLVGESGSGKTTVARCLLRLVEPTAGSIFLEGRDWLSLSGRKLRACRRRIQGVFQDPYLSLNPRMKAAAIVGEPLRIHNIGTSAERKKKTRDLFDEVELGLEIQDRLPSELSGGQRQRLAIARALAIDPHILIADEPTSALDAPVRLQILNLLKSLQRHRGLAGLLISHDLATIERCCSRTVVLHRGKVVESGPTDQLLHSPQHPYTRILVEARSLSSTS